MRPRRELENKRLDEGELALLFIISVHVSFVERNLHLASSHLRLVVAYQFVE
jgi:hypothetical protein